MGLTSSSEVRLRSARCYAAGRSRTLFLDPSESSTGHTGSLKAVN